MTARRRHEKPWKRVNPSGDTVWVARWTDRNGKRHVAGTRKLKRDAQALIDAAYEAEETGFAPGGKTVRAYVDYWLAHHPRSSRTDETNASRIRRVIDVKLEGTPLGDWAFQELRPRHGILLLDHLLSVQGRSAGGAKNILLTLSAMAEDAMRDDVAITNPFRVRVRATDPRVQKAPRKPRVVPVQDLRRLAGAAGVYEPLLRLYVDCGLRLGEGLALYRQDVKLNGCDKPGCGVTVPHLHVRRTAHDGVVTEGTKRERMRQEFEGGRVVPLPAPTVLLLRAMPKRIDTPLVFPGPHGRAWREDSFRNYVWTPARKASGVVASPQDCRHSWVTRMRAEGIDAADLAQIAGHSVEVATATYTHALGLSYERVAEAGA